MKNLARTIVYSILVALTVFIFSACGHSPINPTPISGNLKLTLTLTGTVGGTNYNLGNTGFVSVDGGSTIQADGSGVVALSNLSSGDHTLFVSSDFGYKSKSITVTLGTTDSSMTVVLDSTDQIKYLGTYVDTIGQIQSGVSLKYPTQIRFKVQVMESTYPGNTSSLIVIKQGSVGLSWSEGRLVETVTRTDGPAGSKFLDISWTNYQPCTLTLDTRQTVCQSSSDVIELGMSKKLTQSGSTPVLFVTSVSFAINWHQ